MAFEMIRVHLNHVILQDFLGCEVSWTVRASKWFISTWNKKENNLLYLLQSSTYYLRNHSSITSAKKWVAVGGVVCDRNQGLILVSVSEPIFFFRNRNFFFSIFSFKLQFFLFFFPPLGEVQVFISFRINPDLQKQFKRI